MKNNLIIIFHFLLTIVAWTSWLWLNWPLIALLSLAHITLLETCNGCFLSHYQFKDKKSNNTTFYEWWFSKLGIKNYNRNKMKIFMRYWVPLIIVLLGIMTQEIFKISVLEG